MEISEILKSDAFRKCKINFFSRPSLFLCMRRLVKLIRLLCGYMIGAILLEKNSYTRFSLDFSTFDFPNAAITVWLLMVLPMMASLLFFNSPTLPPNTISVASCSALYVRLYNNVG